MTASLFSLNNSIGVVLFLFFLGAASAQVGQSAAVLGRELSRVESLGELVHLALDGDLVLVELGRGLRC